MVNYAETFTKEEALTMLARIGIKNPARRYLGFYFHLFHSREGMKLVLQYDLKDVQREYREAGVFRELALYGELKDGGYVVEAKEKLAEIEEMAKIILIRLNDKEPA